MIGQGAGNQRPKISLEFKENGGVLNAFSTLSSQAGLLQGPADCALQSAGPCFWRKS